MNDSDLQAEIESWFFGEYFDAWVELATSDTPEPTAILGYYAVPLTVAAPDGFHLYHTPDAVIAALVEHQRPLREAGYAGTQVIDRSVEVYNRYAAVAQAIWSRFDADGQEIQRRALLFHINRTSDGLRITSATMAPTSADRRRRATAVDRDLFGHQGRGAGPDHGDEPRARRARSQVNGPVSVLRGHRHDRVHARLASR